jgi:hypothetical protein
MSNYLNGIYATRKQGKFGEEISIGITEEGLKSLQELEKSGDFRNFTLSPQKSNNDKFSAKPAYKGKQSSSNSTDSGGDLPF